MTDFSKLSDEELQAIVDAAQGASPRRHTIGSVVYSLEVGIAADCELSRRQRERLLRPKVEMGKNMNAPIIEVEHAKLTRQSENSIFRSECPVCEVGILPVNRNPQTFDLLRVDRCTFCGQTFRYTDQNIGGCALT